MHHCRAWADFRFGAHPGLRPDIAQGPKGSQKMTCSWYVTFEVQKRGVSARRRSPRATKLFESEEQAKDFARAKFNEGLIVHAGTIIPHSPRRSIPSGDIPGWLDDEREEGDQDDAQGSNGEAPGWPRS
jgi:hypothetical protein